MKRLALVAVVLAGLAWVGTASAQGPAGLVLETSGTVTPAAKPFTEIAGGTTLTLSGGARLVFAHYHTCKTVTVVGGSVTVTAASYVTRDGKQSDAAMPCPKKVNVRGVGELGGVVYRSISANRGLTLQTEAAFVLVGQRAADFPTARITRDDAQVAEGPIRDRVFRWPAGATPLAPDTAFELTLVPARAGDRAVTTRFSTPAIAAPAGQEPLVVISVD
jgi:hypothetical protein